MGWDHQSIYWVTSKVTQHSGRVVSWLEIAEAAPTSHRSTPADQKYQISNIKPEVNAHLNVISLFPIPCTVEPERWEFSRCPNIYGPDCKWFGTFSIVAWRLECGRTYFEHFFKKIQMSPVSAWHCFMLPGVCAKLGAEGGSSKDSNSRFAALRGTGFIYLFIFFSRN